MNETKLPEKTLYFTSWQIRLHQKCFEIIVEKDRTEIHSQFWTNLSYNSRRYWMAQHVQPTSAKWHRLVGKENFVRKISYIYINFSQSLLMVSVITVCQKNFIEHLGFTSSGVILQLMESRTSDNKLVTSVPYSDMRRKSTPSNKKDANLLDAPIRSLNPHVSHYRREHAPNRLYLPHDIHR